MLFYSVFTPNTLDARSKASSSFDSGLHTLMGCPSASTLESAWKVRANFQAKFFNLRAKTCVETPNTTTLSVLPWMCVSGSIVGFPSSSGFQLMTSSMTHHSSLPATAEGIQEHRRPKDAHIIVCSGLLIGYSSSSSFLVQWQSDELPTPPTPHPRGRMNAVPPLSLKHSRDAHISAKDLKERFAKDQKNGKGCWEIRGSTLEGFVLIIIKGVYHLFFSIYYYH